MSLETSVLTLLISFVVSLLKSDISTLIVLNVMEDKSDNSVFISVFAAAI